MSTEVLRGFTAKAREAVYSAQMDVIRFRQPHIAPEHLLLGLLRVKGAIAVRMLTDLKAPPEQVREALEKWISHGTGFPQVEELMKLPFTPQAERVLELARAEAAELDCPHIGTAYLLLGVLGLENSIAGDTLRALGVTFESVREIVRQNPLE